MVTKDLQALRELEMENLPIMILEKMVEFSTIAEGYPIVAETAVNINTDSGYREKDFTIKHYVYNYGVDSIYLVLACRFPFEKTDTYIGFAKTMYVIFSEKLKKIHVFLEILRKNEKQSMEKSPYYFDVEEFKIEYEALKVYILGQRLNAEEEQTGAFCVAWASTEEQENKLK